MVGGRGLDAQSFSVPRTLGSVTEAQVDDHARQDLMLPTSVLPRTLSRAVNGLTESAIPVANRVYRHEIRPLEERR